MEVLIAVVFAGIVVGWMLKTAFEMRKTSNGPSSGGGNLPPQDDTSNGPINEQ